MYKLIFLMEEIGQYASFKEAFEKLKYHWSHVQNPTQMMILTIWIVFPDNKPRFYSEICNEADKLQLP